MAQIPVSLAPLSWWGILGVAGCSVLLEKGDIGATRFIHECPVIPPLLELAARTLHCYLKGEFSSLIFFVRGSTMFFLIAYPFNINSHLHRRSIVLFTDLSLLSGYYICSQE